MKCTEAREAMLEAPPEVLRGRDNEALTAHLLRCPSCAARARAILEGEAALEEAMERAILPQDPERILDLAQEIEPEGEAPGPARPPSTGPAARGRVLIPLAAAAILAALLLVQDPDLPGPPYTPREPETGLAVRVPPEESVAIVETRKPYITVIWIY